MELLLNFLGEFIAPDGKEVDLDSTVLTPNVTTLPSNDFRSHEGSEYFRDCTLSHRKRPCDSLLSRFRTCHLVAPQRTDPREMGQNP
jgi:hypothetical protein